LRLSLHHEIPENEILRSQWDDLVLRMGRPEVFYTCEWARAVQRAYSSSLRPLLILARDGAALAGVAALAIGKAENEVSFLAGTTADYCDFVAPPQFLPDFASAVFAELRGLGIKQASLANVPADSPTARLLVRVAREHGYSIFSRPAYLCGRVTFVSELERQSLRQAVQRKQMVRRHLKSLGKIAPVRLSHLKSREEIAQALPGFVSAHISRFLSMGLASNLMHAERRTFLAELGALLSAREWVTLSTLAVGERPVAWNYGFQFGSSWFWYQPTFDGSFEQFYPGFCLLAKIIEEACGHAEISEVDLGLGEETYKERFANDSLQTLHLTASRSVTAHARVAGRYHAASAIKRTPALERALRGLLRVCSSAREHMRSSGLLGFMRGLVRRAGRLLFAHEELAFFSYPGHSTAGTGVVRARPHIEPLDSQLLAASAMKYADDSETVQYLIRAARRLREQNAEGFVLFDGEDAPAHFCWATDYANFYAEELKQTLEAPSSRAALIYDCWTPAAARGRGYYSAAISAVASRLTEKGRESWIFTATSNRSSLRGIEKSGFVPQFSLVRRRLLFMRGEVRRVPPVTSGSWSDARI
jgi:CelD/BcsL family acetyltransferase involved in cellulose biosynthesis